MYICRNKTTKVVATLSENKPLLDRRLLSSDGQTYFGITVNTHEVVEGDDSPYPFVKDAFTHDEGIWTVIDEASILPAAKLADEAEVIAYANALISNGIISYNGVQMMVDDVTMSRLNSAINYLGKDADRSMRYATGLDNTILTISIVEANQMHDVISTYRADVANREADLLELVYAATSLADLDVINILSGWPSTDLS